MAFGLTSGPNSLKISKAQQATILEVLVASLIVGAAFVLSIWLVRYIMFNSRVIEAKDESLNNYQASVINTGVCYDANGDGELSNGELDDCDPNTVKLSTIPNSLRYNIMVDMAGNTALESVQRSLTSSCYDTDGNVINYLSRYESATTDSDREYYLTLYQTCSALRTIPDALPSSMNTEAAMSSLNYLFDYAGITPDSMSPDGTSTEATIGTGNLMAVGISFAAQGEWRQIYNMLTTLERSIRNYNFTNFSFSVSSTEGGAETLDFSGSVDTYYAESTGLSEETLTISGSDSRSTR